MTFLSANRSFRSAVRIVAPLLLTATLVACGEDPLQVEIIEETEFDASLGIDLVAMTQLPSGVYILDEVTGTGDTAVTNATATVSYTGWLSDGRLFDSSNINGPFTFVVTTDENVENRPIDGFAYGVIGMQVGGTRLMIIPSDLAYGDRGNGIIAPGALVVFRVTLDELVLP